jgi:hypothetical protein
MVERRSSPVGVRRRLTNGTTPVIFVNMSARNIKEEAKRLLEKLPDDLTGMI